MAHNPTQRSIFSSSEPPLNPSSMDPTVKVHPNITYSRPTSENSDHLFLSNPFYMSNALSKLNPVHKKSTKNPPPTCVDNRLQAKAMTLSADHDGSRFSSIKPKHQQQRRIEARMDQEKVKKSSFKELLAGEKKKFQGVTVKEKKEIDAPMKDNKEMKDLFEGIDIKRMAVSLGGGRRRFLCGSQGELIDFLANNGAKIVSVDMPPFMQIHAVDCARKTRDSLEKFTSKTLALVLKKEFDAVYGPAWHCIVGTSFGSFVTHSVGGFLYFSMDQKLYVLLFKTTVQRAD